MNIFISIFTDETILFLEHFEEEKHMQQGLQGIRGKNEIQSH